MTLDGAVLGARCSVHGGVDVRRSLKMLVLLLFIPDSYAPSAIEARQA